MAPLGGKLVLFGGSGTQDPSPGGYLSDTWTWDGTAWTELSVTAPSPRTQAVMAPYDGKLVLVGGIGTGVDSDAWTWDGASWTQLDVGTTFPAWGFIGASMAPLGTDLVLFVASDNSNTNPTPSADTWTWDGAAWTSLAAIGPRPRAHAVMARVAGKLTLFGGDNSGLVTGNFGDVLGDTWVWDGTAWTAGPDSGAMPIGSTIPEPRTCAVMAVP
jgi:N-acetylneuraminic acid mutarotase